MTMVTTESSLDQIVYSNRSPFDNGTGSDTEFDEMNHIYYNVKHVALSVPEILLYR